MAAFVFVWFVFLAGIASGDAAVTWHAAKQFGPAMLHGKAAYSSGETTKSYFTRLPASASNTTRPAIWNLSQQPAGQFLQFTSNSTAISLRYTLGGSGLNMWQ